MQKHRVQHSKSKIRDRHTRDALRKSEIDNSAQKRQEAVKSRGRKENQTRPLRTCRGLQDCNKNCNPTGPCGPQGVSSVPRGVPGALRAPGSGVSKKCFERVPRVSGTLWGQSCDTLELGPGDTPWDTPSDTSVFWNTLGTLPAHSGPQGPRDPVAGWPDCETRSTSSTTRRLTTVVAVLLPFEI